MRVIILLIALFAEQTTADLPPAGKVLAEWVRAIGGAEAFLKPRTRTSTGTIDVSGMTGTIVIYGKSPDLLARVATLEGVGVASAGYDGSRGWTKQPPGGARELTGADLEARRRDSVFGWEVRLPEVFGDCRTTAAGTIAGAPTLIVECTKDQTKETFHFDAKSALLVRRESKRSSPRGEIVVQTDYADYREVAGVRVPFSIKSSGGPFEISVTLEEVRFDAEIDDKVFAMP